MKKRIRTLLYKLSYYRYTKANPFGLNLGGGHDKIEGFLSVDADFATECDIISRIDKLNYADETISEIYTSHTLEHIHRGDVYDALSEWKRVLGKGGLLYICVPDIEKLFTIYLEGIKDYKNDKAVTNLACEIVYGGQKDKWDFHYNGYSFTTLKAMLEEIGFTNVKRFSHSDISKFSHLKDAGNTARINGAGVSLNLVAEKI